MSYLRILFVSLVPAIGWSAGCHLALGIDSLDLADGPTAGAGGQGATAVGGGSTGGTGGSSGGSGGSGGDCVSCYAWVATCLSDCDPIDVVCSSEAALAQDLSDCTCVECGSACQQSCGNGGADSSNCSSCKSGATTGACVQEFQNCADACSPDGTYAVSGDTIDYSCCTAAGINVNVTKIIIDGTQATTDGVTTTMLGLANCPSESVSYTHTIDGACSETYTLTGTFSDANTFSGDFSVTFTDTVANACDCSGDPCTSQAWSITASKQ